MIQTKKDLRNIMTRKHLESLIEDVKKSILELVEMHESMLKGKYWLLERLEQELREKEIYND